MKIAAWFTAFVLLVLTGFMLLTAGWERPPIDSTQSGFRGTGMADLTNPRTEGRLRDAQLGQVPQSTPLPPTTGGPTAGQIYQNVQVLGDLPIAQFTRLMQSITEWVSPEQGCAYCHELDNLASDSVYTKVVARSMIQMNQNVNSNWDSHVKETGVTCFTCHRGQNVPEYAWFNSDPDARAVGGMAGWRAGQNRATPEVGLTSLPEDPFSMYLEGQKQIRVAGNTALPDGGPMQSIQATEATYALMMHMSTALGVNCTFCHNSRSFGSWEESSPQRVTAWDGIRMARSLNTEYVAPLSSVLPAHRKGPMGQGRKISCETCHQGVNKPLYGLMMAQDYPSLSPSTRGNEAASAQPETGSEEPSALVNAVENVIARDDQEAPGPTSL